MSDLETDTMGTVAAGSAELSGWLEGLRRIDPVLAGYADRTPVVLGGGFVARTVIGAAPPRAAGTAWFGDGRPHARAFVHEIGRALLELSGDLAVVAGDAILEAVLAADVDRYWILRSLVDLAAKGDVAAVEAALGMDLREAYARGNLIPSWECGVPDVRDRLLRESEPRGIVLACVEGMRMGDEWWIQVADRLAGERTASRPRTPRFEAWMRPSVA